jgi:hypothetical protein
MIVWLKAKRNAERAYSFARCGTIHGPGGCTFTFFFAPCRGAWSRRCAGQPSYCSTAPCAKDFADLKGAGGMARVRASHAAAGNPSVPIILYLDGRTITQAKSEPPDTRTADHPVVRCQPALIDFSCSLVRVDVLTASGISPIKRRLVEDHQGMALGTANLSARNVVSFRDQILSHGVECPSCS